MKWSRRSVLCGSAATLATGACAPPQQTRAVCAPQIDWPQSLSPTAAGFDEDLLHACTADFAGASTNFHSLLIERGGQLVSEQYRRGHDKPLADGVERMTTFDACTRHDIRSISKTITALLWGIADAQGKTPPLETPVLTLYPELKHLAGEGREKITLGHLLTMTNGLDWNEEGNYGSLLNDEFGLYWHSSQARYLFSRKLVHPPGVHFTYCGANTAVLAEILVRSVATPLAAYAEKVLFAPLGITDWLWVNDYRGRPLAFAGLELRPRDLLRIGRLALDGGKAGAVQVVPEAWIKASLMARVHTDDGLDYGYFWWLGEVDAIGAARRYAAGFGNGGQRIFIVPDLDLAVAITAGNYNLPAQRLSQGLFKRVVAAVRA